MVGVLSGRFSNFIAPRSVDVPPIPEQLVRSLHRHAAEIRDEMCTIGMTGNIALCAFASIFPSKRQHVTTVAAPVGTYVSQILEPMRDAVIDFFFVTILEMVSDVWKMSKKDVLLCLTWICTWSQLFRNTFCGTYNGSPRTDTQQH